jgi:hypothetical protein
MEQMEQRYGSAAAANSRLLGSALASVAAQLTRAANALGAVVYSVDDQGARILGAALVHGHLQEADPWARLDGRVLLLVSGAVAGPVGISEAARRARSLGAVQVHAAIVDGYPERIVGCDSLTTLRADSRLTGRSGGHRHSAA